MDTGTLPQFSVQENRCRPTDEIQEKLNKQLQTLNLEKVILFGSHARGQAGPDSDIDLLVVTQDEYIPRDFKEKTEIYLRVAEALAEIEKHVPIDLIVHTKAMHQQFIAMQSVFCRRLLAEGKVLYEKTH